jgi:hypothetical protein
MACLASFCASDVKREWIKHVGHTLQRYDARKACLQQNKCSLERGGLGSPLAPYRAFA